MNGTKGFAVRRGHVEDEPELEALIARFRVALAAVRGRPKEPDLRAAKAELAEYREKGYPIYVAVNEAEGLAGYLVCRVDGEVVWAESLYVEPVWRRQGVGATLYAQAEALAQRLGGDPPYNWVDPENKAIIQFLERRGYDVLNLIEIRQPRQGEENLHRIRVGKHTFNR